MLKEQSQFLQRVLFVADLFFIAAGWVIAYYIRFEILVPPEWHPITRYLELLPWIVVIWAIVFRLSGLYDSDQAQRLPSVVYSVAKAVFFGMAAVVASLFFYRDFQFSRGQMVIFGCVTPALMILLRLVIYHRIRTALKQGTHVKRVLIIGAGKVGQRLERAFRLYPWMGFEVMGFLDDDLAKRGGDRRVLGSSQETGTVLDRFAVEGRPIDYVYIALPLRAADRIQEITEELSTRLSHVCLVPDLIQFNIINSRVTDVDGMPVIHLIDEAPMEFRRIVKRGIDIVFSGGVLLALSPVFLALALGVKLSSRGPIFYRQQRMGLNGHVFEMLKLRSMPVNAESATGPKWAEPGEQRATPFGSFLRRTSLDELPQFINVLKGDMSVVGPRPERPVFIDQFKTHVPRYMMRHKMKAGITGWAQVHGWRGDTSIEKRIEYDLYYIQNWSLKLDFKIMVMTLYKGFVNENAY